MEKLRLCFIAAPTAEVGAAILPLLRYGQADSTTRYGTTGNAREFFAVEFSQGSSSQYADSMQRGGCQRKKSAQYETASLAISISVPYALPWNTEKLQMGIPLIARGNLNAPTTSVPSTRPAPKPGCYFENAFGVMDHYVYAGDAPAIYVPLRVIQNGDGAEVLLTLFRQAGMSDAKFAADAEWVARDLLVLKALVTR